MPPFAAASDLSSYFPVFVYLVVVIGFAVVNLVLTHLLGPRRKTAVKQMPYESGMDPVGDAHHRFDVKFYLVAILFLVFDVELLFLYPWATAAYRPEPLIPVELKRTVFVEMLAFVGTLLVSYVYAWRKGVFQWR